MPLRLHLGLTKKVGLPDYGSLGAACHVELDLDGSLLDADLEGFHGQVKRAYAACRQAVEDELGRQQEASQHGVTNGKSRSSPATATKRPATNGSANRANGTHSSRVTTKQLDYARQLADQIEGLGVRKLHGLVDRLYGKPLAELSSFEGSGLIDTLKALKTGDVVVDDLLAGAAP